MDSSDKAIPSGVNTSDQPSRTRQRIYSDEERKKRIADSKRRWKEKNKDKTKENNRLYRENNGEKIAQLQKRWYEKRKVLKVKENGC